MKKEILDAPLHHSFSDFLKKGETIIWEGQPSLLPDATVDPNVGHPINYDLLTLMVGIIIGLVFFTSDKPFVVFFSFIPLIIFALIFYVWDTWKKRSYTYAITQNQILFHFKAYWFGEKKIYSIPFSEIKDIIVVMTYDIKKIKEDSLIPRKYHNPDVETTGTIFIALHHPQLINFDTVDITNNNKRHQPTLEQLKNVNEIAKIIREGIKANRLT